MSYSLKIISGKTKTEIAAAGDLAWSDSLDQLGAQFSFTIPYSAYDEQFNTIYPAGSVIQIMNGKAEVMRGIITSDPINASEYSGYDYGFYLNKSETIIQFKKMRADKAVKKLCSMYSIPVGSIVTMKTSITKLYKDMIIADIIKDILKKNKSESGTKTKTEMRNGKFYVVKSGDKKITPYYTTEAGDKALCTSAASISGTHNIEELRNSVQYAGTSEKAKQIKATAKDSKSIKKYGLLSDVETEDKLTKAKAKNKAKNKLTELNKVATDFTAEMPGSDDVRSGVLLYFDDDNAKIKGWYKVKSCSHTVTGGYHWMSCEMGRP